MTPDPRRKLREIGSYLSPILVMGLLLAVSSIPGESSGIPRDAGLLNGPVAWLLRLFSMIPPLVHDILHIPGYLVLAWSLYLPLSRWVTPTTCLMLTLVTATGYGALMELHQASIPGRYPGYGDAALNFTGALLGCLLAGRSLRGRRTSFLRQDKP